jgi:ribosomal protein S27E
VKLKQVLRRARLELRRDRAAAMRCPGCAKRNVIVVDDRGKARCANCGHEPAIDLLK